MNGGVAIYDIDKNEFSNYMVEFLSLGADILGGCCGTTPEYIATVREKYKIKILKKERKEIYVLYVLLLNL